MVKVFLDHASLPVKDLSMGGICCPVPGKFPFFSPSVLAICLLLLIYGLWGFFVNIMNVISFQLLFLSNVSTCSPVLINSLICFLL